MNDEPLPSPETVTPNAPPGDRLPSIPGGWQLDDLVIGQRTVRLIRPALPDLFLDDERVIAANRESDYMPYWSYLWPASLVMAEVVAAGQIANWNAALRADEPDARERRKHPFAGQEVLELGCGVGLVGLMAALNGATVTFSDYDPVAVQCAVENARLNGIESAEGLVLDWRNPPSRQWPIILGCDLLYERRDQPLLVDCISRVLSPTGTCFLADPGRLPSQDFLPLAHTFGFELRILNRDSIERPTTHPREIRQGEFHLIELRQSNARGSLD